MTATTTTADPFTSPKTHKFCVQCEKHILCEAFPNGIKDHLTKVCFLCWNTSFAAQLAQGSTEVRINHNKSEGSGLNCVTHGHALAHQEVRHMLSRENWALYAAILKECAGTPEEVPCDFPPVGILRVATGLAALAAEAASQVEAGVSAAHQDDNNCDENGDDDDELSVRKDSLQPSTGYPHAKGDEPHFVPVIVKVDESHIPPRWRSENLRHRHRHAGLDPTSREFVPRGGVVPPVWPAGIHLLPGFGMDEEGNLVGDVLRQG
jgi:hypothetical protein